MSKLDIPEGEGHYLENTELNVQELPEPWEWRSANRNRIGKVNVFFGYDTNTVGGKLGEIDNFNKNGSEFWTLCIRDIKSLDGNGSKDTIPGEDCEVSEEFDSLEEAIDSVPSIVNTFY